MHVAYLSFFISELNILSILTNNPDQELKYDILYFIHIKNHKKYFITNWKQKTNQRVFQNLF